MELTSLILITYEASPGFKGSIVTVLNYLSTVSRYPLTKNPISVSTSPSIFPIDRIWVLSPLSAVYLCPFPAPL